MLKMLDVGDECHEERSKTSGLSNQAIQSTSPSLALPALSVPIAQEARTTPTTAESSFCHLEMLSHPTPHIAHQDSHNMTTPIPKPSPIHLTKDISRVAKYFKILYVKACTTCFKLKGKIRKRKALSMSSNAVSTESQETDSVEDDVEYVRTIEVVFKDRNGCEQPPVYARAQFDTGNPINLISPDFVAKCGQIFEPSEGETILETAGNGQFISTGTITGRWTCKARHGPPHFDPKFMDAEFEVSKHTERFDVVIGSDTISKERLMVLAPSLCLTGFRTKTPKRTSGPAVECLNKLNIFLAKYVQENERDQRAAIEQNEARKRQLLQQQVSF